MLYRIIPYLIFALILSMSPEIINAQTTSANFDSAYATLLDEQLTQIGIANDYQGLSAAVLVPGQGIWVGSWGEAHSNTPVTPATRFGIASNSKAIAAALLIKLQEEGFLNLDDAIGDYLPSHPNINSTISIRQLLTHTSGLWDFINDSGSAYGEDPDMVWNFNNLFQTIGTPYYLPGERYDYSNTNYLLAGMIAEAATGESIQDLLQSRIFEPLSLDIAYPLGTDVFDGPYANVWNGSFYSLDPNGSEAFLTFPSTAGAVWSTAYDMVRWYDAFFGKNWLSPESQAALRTRDGYLAYGLGVRLSNRLGRSFYYHAGAWGFRSYMIHDPESGVSVCLLSNHRNAPSLADPARSLFAEAIEQKPAAPYDIRITDIIPQGPICNSSTTPTLLLRNDGTEPIQEFTIITAIDGTGFDTTHIVLSNALTPNGQFFQNVNLSIAIPDGQKHRLQVLVGLDEVDGTPNNNETSIEFRYEDGSGLPLPFFEDFEDEQGYPSSMTFLDTDNLLDWSITEFAAFSGSQSLAKNAHSDGNIGATYTFDLPPLQIPATGAALQFAFAHASYWGSEKENLRGYISTNCGASFEPLFELLNNDFITATATTALFQPEPDEWSIQTVDLGNYADQQVIIRFELENDFGNIAYLDNIRVDMITEVEEVVSSPFRINPNPARNHVQVSWPQELGGETIVMIDLLGRVLQTFQLSPGQRSLQIPRNELPSGWYYLKLAGSARAAPFVWVD